MLVSIDGKVITKIPYRSSFDLLRKRLSDDEYQAIVEELNNRINSKQVLTSSWLPGSDWSGTVFFPIYSRACNGLVEEAGKFFGLILWVVMMNRPEKWAYGHYQKNNIPIQGLTYFIVQE